MPKIAEPNGYTKWNPVKDQGKLSGSEGCPVESCLALYKAKMLDYSKLSFLFDCYH